MDRSSEYVLPGRVFRYGVQYRVSRTLPELLRFWGAADTDGDGGGRWKGISPSSLHLPEPNRFVPDDFSLVCDKIEGDRVATESEETMRKDAGGVDSDSRGASTGDATVDSALRPRSINGARAESQAFRGTDAKLTVEVNGRSSPEMHAFEHTHASASASDGDPMEGGAMSMSNTTVRQTGENSRPSFLEGETRLAMTYPYDTTRHVV